MTNNNYRLTMQAGSLLHAASKYWLVRDSDEPVEHQQLRARVKSGDYLSLVATDLDEVSQIIIDSNEQQSVMLQHIINDLLFLERHYRLTPK